MTDRSREFRRNEKDKALVYLIQGGWLNRNVAIQALNRSLDGIECRLPAAHGGGTVEVTFRKGKWTVTGTPPVN